MSGSARRPRPMPAQDDAAAVGSFLGRVTRQVPETTVRVAALLRFPPGLGRGAVAGGVRVPRTALASPTMDWDCMGWASPTIDCELAGCASPTIDCELAGCASPTIDCELAGCASPTMDCELAGCASPTMDCELAGCASPTMDCELAGCASPTMDCELAGCASPTMDCELAGCASPTMDCELAGCASPTIDRGALDGVTGAKEQVVRAACTPPVTNLRHAATCTRPVGRSGRSFAASWAEVAVSGSKPAGSRTVTADTPFPQ